MFAKHERGKPINFAVLPISVLALNKAAGLAVSVCGATIRPERGLASEAGARKQKVLIREV
ncbi:hypothetical protein [Okeania sp. SIO2C9]|uniref:hypothetical protein n=1 Tax=Okeania sp. SIO2C9 TaxID=2607791 RepID=UPI0025EDB45E|nr:hypothetical protein [Okeania sp. SIO2C9]